MDSNKDFLDEAMSILVGSSSLAYVRPVATEKGEGYAVCSADGMQLAVFASRDAAFFAARQHDLEPVMIH
ncbi:MAG: DUF1150 family protein [Rickettsiales bacterium]|nr:DUF1150 family protein [Rickettsiales bacterium]